MPCKESIMSTLKTPKNNGSFRLKSINTVCFFLAGDLGWQNKYTEMWFKTKPTTRAWVFNLQMLEQNMFPKEIVYVRLL